LKYIYGVKTFFLDTRKIFNCIGLFAAMTGFALMTISCPKEEDANPDLHCLSNQDITHTFKMEKSTFHGTYTQARASIHFAPK